MAMRLRLLAYTELHVPLEGVSLTQCTGVERYGGQHCIRVTLFIKMPPSNSRTVNKSMTNLRLKTFM